MTKSEKKTLTSQAMFAAMDATVFISLGNDMNQQTKEASSMVAMSSHMGKGHIYTVSNENTKMQTLAKFIINEDPDKFLDLLMDHMELKPCTFEFKK